MLKVSGDLSICNHIKMTEVLQVHKSNTQIERCTAHQINVNMNTNQRLDAQHINELCELHLSTSSQIDDGDRSIDEMG